MTDSTALLSGPGVDRLRKSSDRIVITGAGGWIGLATLELLRNSLYAADFRARVHAFGSAERTLFLRDGTPVWQRPLTLLDTLEPAPTILLHTAFLTKARAERMNETEYRDANLAIRNRVLGALDRIGVERLFLASSGAAGFATDPHASTAMRLYGAMKLEDEKIFGDWARANAKSAVIGRLFALSGPYINNHDSYALAGFILDALAGRPISVRAAHRVVRGYVAIRELMSLVFAMLTDRNSEIRRFETGGEPMELEQSANIIAKVVGSPGVERALPADRPEDRYAGNNAAYQQLLSDYGIDHIPFHQQVIETAEYLSAQSHQRGSKRMTAQPLKPLRTRSSKAVASSFDLRSPAGGPEISVVIPCRNEEANVERMAHAVIAQMETVCDDFELIFIENCSTDGTVEALRKACAEDYRVRAIINTRNFGQMRSPTHGIFQARGKAVINLCCDFQDPPEMIPEFVRRWRNGSDIVLGVREQEKSSRMLTAMRNLSYALQRKFGDYPIIPNATGFGIYDARVVRAIEELNEPEPFFRALLVETGYPIEIIPFPRAQRAAGKSNNNFFTLLDFALNGLAGSSKSLLRYPLYVGFLASVLTMTCLAGAVFAAFTGRSVQLWLFAAMLEGQFAMLFLFLGLMGVQIGLVSDRTRKAPLVVERERINFPGA